MGFIQILNSKGEYETIHTSQLPFLKGMGDGVKWMSPMPYYGDAKQKLDEILEKRASKRISELKTLGFDETLTWDKNGAYFNVSEKMLKMPDEEYKINLKRFIEVILSNLKIIKNNLIASGVAINKDVGLELEKWIEDNYNSPTKK